MITDGAPVGVVFQSPLDHPVTLTPMPAAAVVAVVAAIAAAAIDLPGVSGEAGTAARFAGEYTEQRRVSAVPVYGQRLYEVDTVVAPAAVPGAVRVATAADRDRVIEWLTRFQADTGEGGDPTPLVDRRLPNGHFWLWEDGAPVAMAGRSIPVHGVARVQAVYTPPDRRRQGYASALVAALSAATRARGERCILYTDLGNATSNSVYRRLGYRAAGELLRYRFE